MTVPDITAPAVWPTPATPQPLVTRYFYDFEFLEDGRTIDPISVGVVSSDGREYYAIYASAPLYRVVRHEWLMTNVAPMMPWQSRQYSGAHSPYLRWDPNHPEFQHVREPDQIAEDLADFMRSDPSGSGREHRELWADYGAYDHVALCQTWGIMAALPDHVPMWTHDLRQALGNLIAPERLGGDHHALEDARYCRDVHDWLVARARP